MCVAFWSLEHPDYALILCSNRDEYLSRPTENAHFHSFGLERGSSREQDGFVLSGRDLQAGGTWFGINRAGRVALLLHTSVCGLQPQPTNITEPSASYTSSRGHLVSSFLTPSAPDLDDFVHGLTSREGPLQPKFAGFNLLVFSPTQDKSESQKGQEDHDASGRHVAYDVAALITNSGGGGAITCRRLSKQERRAGGLSNGIDCQGASDWPKVKEGRSELEQLLDNLSAKGGGVDETELIDGLFNILTFVSPSRPLNRLQLRNSIQIPPLHMTSSLDPNAHALARPCGPGEHSTVPPQGEVYATRLSTVLLVRRDGRVTFVERDIWKLGSGVGKLEENSAAASDGSGATAVAASYQVLAAETDPTGETATGTAASEEAIPARRDVSGPSPASPSSRSTAATTAIELPHAPVVVRGDPRDDRVFRFTLLPPGNPVRVTDL